MNNDTPIFEDMRFLDLDDFFIKKVSIKQKYEELDYNQKEIYKWYFFYQLCLVKYRNIEKKPIKDVFWDYLNGNANTFEANKLYLDFCIARDSSLQKKN